MDDVLHGFDLIREWAKARNLIEGSTPQAQMLKMTEEVGELATAVRNAAAKNNGKATSSIVDAIGDCAVVLVILAAQYGLQFEDCIAEAYAVIKDRKGRMVDGVFIKEEDEKAA